MKRSTRPTSPAAVSLSVPSTRAYAMKRICTKAAKEQLSLSVPSTRAYAMKHGEGIDSGREKVHFQYPQLGPTR